MNMKYRYHLEVTSEAFGPTETPIGWHVESQHTTISAAIKAYDKDRTEMSAAIGANAWSHHTRIVPAPGLSTDDITRDVAELQRAWDDDERYYGRDVRDVIVLLESN
jgi:hypothetical protein